MSKKVEIINAALSRPANTKAGVTRRKEKHAISAREIADTLGYRIQYVCNVLNKGVADGQVLRTGSRCNYVYFAA